MNTLLLTVEDEAPIRDMIRYALTREGHAVHGVENAVQAREWLVDNTPDLVLVDWMLPGGSGLELVRKLRREEVTRGLPIIMLTARVDENDVATGLDAGADDYITKPFSPRELNSRVKALLRRTHNFIDGNRLERGELVLDSAAHRVTANGETVPLGHTEFKLLRFMMQNPDRVYSRAQLLDHVWGRGTFIEERTVDVHILRLRKSLKPGGLERMLETVRGAGYRLNEKAV